jgi:DNA-binding helix-hairpin-helix protein with protein kinase domain
MGIDNIHILINPDPPNRDLGIQAFEAVMQQLIEAHRRGQHPWGLKIRACPLCQSGK